MDQETSEECKDEENNVALGGVCNEVRPEEAKSKQDRNKNRILQTRHLVDLNLKDIVTRSILPSSNKILQLIYLLQFVLSSLPGIYPSRNHTINGNNINSNIINISEALLRQ